jgi:hypothetical protein
MAISASAIQSLNSYTVTFSGTSDLYTTQPINIVIKRNDIGVKVFDNVVQGLNYSHTFDEASAVNVTYTYEFTVYFDETLFDTVTDEFTVSEYKPVFTLPTTVCVEKGQVATFKPATLSFGDQDYCKVSPNYESIHYEYFEFNQNAGVWESKDTFLIENTALLTPIDVDDIDLDALAYTWTPNVLTMIKFIVTVTNCNTEVVHETTFPVCGAWKLRRLSCGNYRLYNYKSSAITYNVYDDVSVGAIPYLANQTLAGFSYVDLKFTVEGVYKISADGISQYLFNFCEIEACVLSLQKKILLDGSLCDACRMDKVLYQKALRLIPVYETWKKLLDKDWIYDMQYLTTDIDNELTRIYDAQELYAEIKKLCEGCEDSSTKNCNC